MIPKKNTFKRVRLSTRRFSKKFIKKNLSLKVILLIAGFAILLPTLMLSVWFYKNIIKELPDISKIEDLSLSQTTTITDRNGETLYKLFEENRHYVPIENISPNIINAIIAVEDKNFWTNPGIDVFATIRAGIYDVLGGGYKQGGSTLTQQTIKGLLLTKDKTITRKLKEIVLSFQLSDYVKNSLKKKYSNLSSDELDKKMKEKVLELYLNHAFLGNNNYGIETASVSYFGTSAQYLSVGQAIVIAGIPQAPSRYNPFTNKDPLMGKITITDEEGEDFSLSGDIMKAGINEVSNKMKNSSFSFNKETNSFLKQLKDVLEFDFEVGGRKYKLKYDTGRKDIVMGRMYEDGYIDQETMKKTFLELLDYKFSKQKIDIKAPHFVFHVIDELKQKYGEDILTKGGLKITTSLDYKIQKMAEDAINANMKYLISKGANNTALIYTDSKSGDILAYVGSANYNDEEIDGKVDVIQSPRQPGSTVKPLIYSLGFIKNAFTLDTPVFDIPMKIGGNEPQNVDGKFLGMMPLRKALSYSRNIPAIKMYFADGQEDEVKKFFRSLGVTTIKDNFDYGYPMAIGAGEVKMQELANAYTHLSALGQPAEMNPILEIRGPDDSIIYKKKEQKQEQVIPAGIAYLIRQALSDKANFPPSWVSTYNYPGFPVATKSGTTDIKLKNGKKLPRDGWFAAYTPSKVAIFWAGNTKGEPMNVDAYGGWLNATAWKQFFSAMQKAGYISKEDMEQKEVKNIAISKISGKLATDYTPSSVIINTLAYINNIPKADESIEKIEIDSTCGGKVTDDTPADSVQTAYLVKPYSIIPDGRDIDDILRRYKSGGSSILGEIGNIYFQEPTEECANLYREETVGNNSKFTLEILSPKQNSNITKEFSLWIRASSKDSEIEKIEVKINNNLIKVLPYNKKEINDAKTITIDDTGKESNVLSITVYDKDGNQLTKKISINLISKDENPPYLIKDLLQVTKKSGKYSITAIFKDDESIVKGGKIYQGSEIIKEFKGNNVTFQINDVSDLNYEIYDNSDNTTKQSFDIPN